MADQELKIKIKSELQNAGLTELKQALKDNTKAMDELRKSGQQGTQAWEEAKTKSAVLTNEIKGLSREYKGLDANVKQSKFSILEYGENLTVVLNGITQFTNVLKDLGGKLFEIGKAGAEFKNLKSHFEDLEGGAENATEKIILLRQASSGNLNDAELIKYANRMGDLGYTTEQTAKLLDISETASDNLGITIEEANSKLLAFIETGRGRGLKEMGISFAEVKAEMDKLANAQDLDLKKLDEEALKRIRSNAIITLYGHSVSDIAKKEMDEADMLEQLTTAFENAKLKIGEIVGGVLSTLANLLGTNTEKVAVFITVLGGLVTGVIAVTSAVYMLTIAMKGLDISMGGLLTVLGAVVAIAGVFAISFDNSAKSIEKTKEETLKSIPVSKEYQNVLTELGISANNMAEAYNNIEQAIYSMTSAQVESAEKFVEAELEKINAIKLEMEAENIREMHNAQKAPVYSQMEFAGQEQVISHFIVTPAQLEEQGITDEEEKLQSILNKLKERENFLSKDIVSPTGGKGRNERASENTEEKETIDKVINSIKTAIEYETKWGVLKKGFYQTELDYLKSKESLSNEGKNETERQKNLTAYKDELLLLTTLVQQYDIFGKKVNETTGVLKQSEPEKRRAVSIADAKKELEDWAEFNKNLPFNQEKSALEEYAERVAESVKTMTEAFGGFFGAIASGQKVGDSFKDLLKQLAMQLLNFLEVQYLAATASTFFKAIFSLGGTLTTDLVWQMIGFTALQAAKGLVGALAEGGEFMQGAYLVGERGPELALMGGSGYMINNKDLTNLLTMKMSNNNYNNNNINFGIDVDWLKLRKVSDKEFIKYKNFPRA